MYDYINIYADAIPKGFPTKWFLNTTLVRLSNTRPIPMQRLFHYLRLYKCRYNFI